MRIKILLLISYLFIDYQALQAQCEVVATALPNDITCGSCVTLTAFGEGQGNSVFTENFNSGAPTGWQSTAQATYSNPCDPSGVDGTPHLWMGDATGVPRQMTTTAFDFSTASAGATICFDMLFAEQGDASPCEGPDEPDEGVYLQYSTNNGATWVTINYFDPNGGNDASLINWNNWCFALPAAALTANTQIRWFQDNDSGADYDHWGLDNVNIYFNDPTFNITWQHDGYSYGVGVGGGANPTPVCPQTTTTYTVTMTNGTTTCTDNVTITVTDPEFRVSASPDTTLCPGACANLLGEATVIVSPAKTPTYSNSEVAALTGLPSAADLANILIPCVNFSGCNCPNGSSVPFLGTCPAIFNGTLSMNINITDLNTTSLQTGELTSVCIGDALMLAGNLTPFAVTLTCPSGNTITLANAGDLTGTTLTNTCFDLTSTTPVSAGSSPYNGTFQPIDPLTNLNGCDGNGVWTLSFTGTFNLSSGTIPIGFLNGWDISFDDPEIAYTGDFTWSPTTNMTAANTLTPNVCPPATQSYTIVVTDTAGCASDSATVVVTVDPAACCAIDLTFTTVPPSCSLSDGSIDLSVANGSGNYSYVWSNGLPATQDAVNVGSGSYTVTVTDLNQGCQKDTTILLSSPNSPSIDSINVFGTFCGIPNNGTMDAYVSGGTAPYSYSLDGGTTTQLSASFIGLAPGNYILTVEDASSCTTSAPFTIAVSSAPVIDSTQIVATSCALTNGSISIFASQGLAPLSYSIDNGVTFVTTNVFSNLAANTYQIVVRDVNDCTVTSSASVGASTVLVIDSIPVVNPLCLQSNGQLTVFTSGGQAPLLFSLDNGVTTQSSNTFAGLASGSYNILVEDAAGCTSTQTVVLNAANGPTINGIVSVDPSCANNDGSLTINASGGALPYTYSVDNGLTFQSSNVFTNLAGANYSVLVTDDSGCSFAQNVLLQAPLAPFLDSVIVMLESCGSGNGTISVYATGGVSPLLYSIDGGVTFQASSNFTGLSAGSFVVIVEDQNGCSATQNVVVGNSGAPTISSILITNTSCALDNGVLVVSVAGGVPPLEYSIDNGVTFQASNTFNSLPAGAYTVIVREQGNLACSATSTVAIDFSTGISIDNVDFFDETCFGANDGSLFLTISGGNAPYTITYNGEVGNALNENLAPGTYNIVVTDNQGCVSPTGTATIAAGIFVEIETINDTSVAVGESVVLSTSLNGVQGGTYEWLPLTDLSCSDCSNPTALVLQDVQYQVVYTDPSNTCSDSALVAITAIAEDPFCLFPSAFSPNADTYNDVFRAICDDIHQIELKIYNRWGELIFTDQGATLITQWDGTIGSKEAPLDVYIYVANIEYVNGNIETLTGNFTLIR